jgi:hypothetical protein
MADSDSAPFAKRPTEADYTPAHAAAKPAAPTGTLSDSLVGGLFGLNIKVAVFIFVLFMALMSDVFIDNVLGGFDDAASPTGQIQTKGAVIQGIALVIGYLLVDMLARNEIL